MPQINLNDDGDPPYDALEKPRRKRKNDDRGDYFDNMVSPSPPHRKFQWWKWLLGFVGVAVVGACIFYAVLLYQLQGLGEFFVSLADPHADDRRVPRLVTPSPLPPPAERLCLPENFENGSLYVDDLTRELNQEIYFVDENGERACRVELDYPSYRSLDGNYEVIHNWGEKNHQNFLRNTETGEVTPMGYGFSATWSPDSTKIAYNSIEALVAVYDVGSGDIIAELELPYDYRADQIAWANDEIVVYTRVSTEANGEARNVLQIYLMNIVTGENQLLAKSEDDANIQSAELQRYDAVEEMFYFRILMWDDTDKNCSVSLDASLNCTLVNLLPRFNLNPDGELPFDVPFSAHRAVT